MMDIAQKYRYEFVDYDTFMPEFRRHKHIGFAATAAIDLDDVHDADENARRAELERRHTGEVKLCIAVYDGDKLIGWCLGRQDNGDVFTMYNSVVFPQYRRQGIYKEMLRMIVARAVEEGFQQIRSRHVASNNAVIIPKLEFGFYIRGMEVCDRYGVMALLSYYPHEKRNALFRYRTGESPIHPLDKQAVE